MNTTEHLKPHLEQYKMPSFPSPSELPYLYITDNTHIPSLQDSEKPWASY